jgi:hypothetical protein
MKNIAVIILVLIISSCANEKTNENLTKADDKKAVSESQTKTYYGKQISEESKDDYLRLKDLVMNSGKESTTLSGEIIETCQKKGCWMSFNTGSDTLFVKFRDYGFFVPTSGVDGKTAVVEGDLFLDTTSVEMLKHYAEDAGKTTDEIALITEPSYDVNFIADGVIIKD